jgi:hypothetical protein
MKLREFIRKRPHLVWYTRNYNDLSEASVLEAVLNYGDWDDVQKLIKIIGVKKVAEIFKKQTNARRRRINYYPKIVHYFKLYFNAHAS